MKRILNWKLVVFVASLLLSSLSFVACDPDKDDEDNEFIALNYKELIIGKWEMNKICYESYVNGELDYSDTTYINPDDPEYVQVVFASNGKMINTYFDGSPSDTMNYSIVNDTLSFNNNGEIQKFNIKLLNSSSLNIYGVFDDGSGEVNKIHFDFNRLN